MLLFLSNDVLNLNVAQRAAAPYIYDLFEWEASNFLSKWIHRTTQVPLLHSKASDGERAEQVREFFSLNDDIRLLQADLTRLSALSNSISDPQVAEAQSALDAVVASRDSIRDDVEESIEARVSAVADQLGLGAFGDILFPPVDVRLSSPPKLLITSPRDKILRTHDVLLDSNVRLSERDEIESKLLDESNLSAIVLNIGGLATYPASVPGNQPMRWTVQATSHEWLHHYFFFRPLGQNMFDDGNMVSLNETIANTIGRELGDMAFELLGGVIPPPPPPAVSNQAASSNSTNGEVRFDFNETMRETRLRTEELLGEGRIEEAEAYMEGRRRILVSNGYNIRKINQAYFAFHGTYADSPSSVSPIGDQVARFRASIPDLGDFIREASQISSYQMFLDRLEELESDNSKAN